MQVLAELDRLVRERDAVGAVLTALPESWAQVRSALNEL